VSAHPAARSWVPARPAWIAALVAFATAMAVFVASQAFLPGLVAGRLRDDLTPFASDVSVSVRASPAIELLFGHADEVKMDIGTLHARRQASVPSLLAQLRSTTNADARVARILTPNGVHLENVAFGKRGAKLVGSAAITPAEIRAALPAGISLTAVGSRSHTLVVSASLNVFGHTLSASALVEAVGGKMVLVPTVPLLPSITLFSSPQVAIDSLELNTEKGTYLFSARGHLT
jgi:hypothetical protein